MGWKESLGYFCSVSETSLDMMANLAGFNGRLYGLPSYTFKKHMKAPDPLPEGNSGKDGHVIP